MSVAETLTGFGGRFPSDFGRIWVFVWKYMNYKTTDQSENEIDTVLMCFMSQKVSSMETVSIVKKNLSTPNIL